MKLWVKIPIGEKDYMIEAAKEAAEGFDGEFVGYEVSQFDIETTEDA